MSKDLWYRQCRYETETPDGIKVDVAWIPEQLARVGRKIYFGVKTDRPEELWTITAVYDRQRESFLREHQMAYRHQREMSDV